MDKENMSLDEPFKDRTNIKDRLCDNCHNSLKAVHMTVWLPIIEEVHYFCRGECYVKYMRDFPIHV